MASRLYATSLRPLISPGAGAVFYMIIAPDAGLFPEVVPTTRTAPEPV